MTGEQWRRIEELFARGLRASASVREDILLQAGDPDVIAAVRQLWTDASVSSPDFLSDPDRRVRGETPHVGMRVEGRFELRRLLGVGGMGEVFAATDLHLDREVALKFLTPGLLEHAGRRLLLEREARALCRLAGHPSICTMHDVRWDGEMPYLLMEFLAGETLAARLSRGPLTVAEAVAIASSVIDGLEHAHANGVIHRDLKPANVMLTPFVPKIFDFGIARHGTSASASDVSLLAPPGTFVGSVSYTSPEQAEGLPIDTRSDIFSLGCVLYEMVSAVKAFDGATRLATLAAVLRAEPRSLRDRDPAIPAGYEQVVIRCLKKDPAERYQRAADVREALDRLVPETFAKPTRRNDAPLGRRGSPTTPPLLDEPRPAEWSVQHDDTGDGAQEYLARGLLARGWAHPIPLLIAATHGVMVCLALLVEVAYEWPDFASWVVPVGIATGVTTMVMSSCGFAFMCARVERRPTRSLVTALGILVGWSTLLAIVIGAQLPDRPIVRATIQTMTASVGYPKSLLEALALPVLALVPLQVACLLEADLRRGRVAQVHRFLTSTHPTFSHPGALYVRPNVAAIVFAVVTVWWIAVNARLTENLEAGPFYGLFLRLCLLRAASGLSTFLVVLVWYLWMLNEVRRLTGAHLSRTDDTAS